MAMGPKKTPMAQTLEIPHQQPLRDKEREGEKWRGILHFKPEFCLEISVPGLLRTETSSACLHQSLGERAAHADDHSRTCCSILPWPVLEGKQLSLGASHSPLLGELCSFLQFIPTLHIHHHTGAHGHTHTHTRSEGLIDTAPQMRKTVC